MLELLVYGTGNVWRQIKKVLNWKQVHIKAFLETVKSKNNFEGCFVYTPDEYLGGEKDSHTYDFILCASVNELEMKKYLMQLGISEKRIVSGRVDFGNFMNYPDIYDVSRIIAYQNREIMTSMQRIVARNRFEDMRKGIVWMKDVSLIAGEWAVSYDYMYVMARILQIQKPNKILEMGLGQSSKILSRYQQYANCDYEIVEQNEDWYHFFRSEFDISENAEVHIKPIKQVYNVQYKVDVNCYTDFHSVINNRKYDFISIDGPWGSEGISRIDILPYVPQCLEKSFCILLDDYERMGETNMVFELENILRTNGIAFYKKVYGPEKKFCLIASNNLPFFDSL